MGTIFIPAELVYASLSKRLAWPYERSVKVSPKSTMISTTRYFIATLPFNNAGSETLRSIATDIPQPQIREPILGPNHSRTGPKFPPSRPQTFLQEQVDGHRPHRVESAGFWAYRDGPVLI
jgi:hypothetical protein